MPVYDQAVARELLDTQTHAVRVSPAIAERARRLELTLAALERPPEPPRAPPGPP